MSRSAYFLTLVSLGAAALAGCGGSDAGSAGPTTVTQVVVTKTVEAAAEPKTTEAPKRAAAADVEAKTDSAGSGDGSFTMPDEVGKGLQEAQDDIQAASGNPVFFTDSTDAGGKGRMQLVDSNWKVCSQNTPAGERVDADANISFAAVKLGEDCP